MDVRLLDGNGVDAGREILSERPDTQVIILTSYSDEERVMASIMAHHERRILPLIAEGKSNRAIADELVLSERTVNTYVSNILTRFAACVSGQPKRR
jgi:DNA-binding NarL/FixJ family response regulator